VRAMAPKDAMKSFLCMRFVPKCVKTIPIIADRPTAYVTIQ
jgi:hypothetical protein